MVQDKTTLDSIFSSKYNIFKLCFSVMMKVVLSLFSLTAGLFFEMSEKETKCFIEELPEETIVIGNYRTEVLDKNSGEYQKTLPRLGMHVEVKDPNMKVI
jgi:hypothetical protein